MFFQATAAVAIAMATAASAHAGIDDRSPSPRGDHRRQKRWACRWAVRGKAKNWLAGCIPCSTSIPMSQKLNEHVEQALKKEAFPRDKYGSVAIVNMGATWIPNFLIAKRLKKKQAEFTHTTFVKDQSKLLVRAWGLKDDSYHVVVFDRRGNVAWSKGGKLSSADITDLITTIRHNL